jgi:hypothetical protein
MKKKCKTLVRREETKVIIFLQRKGHITLSKIEKGPLPSLSYWHLLSLYIHSSNSRKENPKNRKDSFLVKPDLWALVLIPIADIILIIFLLDKNIY